MTAVVHDLVAAAVERGLTAGEVRGERSRRDELAAAVHAAQVRHEQWRAVAEKLDEANRKAARAHSGAGECKACGQPLRWVTTETGKPMSLDPLPRPNGNVILVNRGQSRLVAQVLGPSSLPVVGRPAYQAHFASCPYADQMRRRRRARAEAAGQPRPVSDRVCPSCGTPLHRGLLEIGLSVHPTCEERP